MRRSKRFLPIALFLVATTAVMSVPEETLAKPYACGKETCKAHETKANCQVCTSAVCDKDSKGKEYLVPGTATTTKCTEPGKREVPRGGALPIDPGQIAPPVDVTPGRPTPPTAPGQPPLRQ